MKQKLIGLSQRYVAALRIHLKQGPRASCQPALALGGEAVALGLDTLELARIHERALTTLELASGKNGLMKRAEKFFTEAVTPIEESHRAVRPGKIDLNPLHGTLGQRHDKNLAESLQLQQRLRQLTHKVLAAQEVERKQISHELQDEIAQTLLGINIRLLSLKHKARSNPTGLRNEIARAQRLVVKSARSVRRFAHELDTHQPA
jgi:signal transduction histidine kinase